MNTKRTAAGVGGVVALLAAGVLSATQFVGGSSSVTLNPGDSWQAAYAAASPGDVITVSPGTYAPQTLNYVSGKGSLTDDPNVVFKGGPGVTMTGPLTLIGVRHASFEGIDASGPLLVECSDSGPAGSQGQQLFDVSVSDSHFSTARLENAQYLTISKDVFGPSVDANFKINGSGDTGGANCTDASPDHITVEDSDIHNFRESSTATHAECIFIEGGHYITFRRNTIRACSVFTFFVKNQLSAGIFGIQHLTIENNFLGHPVASAARPNAGGTALSLANGQYSDVLVQNNSMNGTLLVRTDSTGSSWSNVVLSGNIATSMGATGACTTPGVTWVGNAYTSPTAAKCANDLGVGINPGWIDQETAAEISSPTSDPSIDYHLMAGAWPIDRLLTGAAEDFDQQARPVGPAFDVGADEFGTVEPPPTTTTTTTTSTTGPTTTTSTTTTSTTTTTEPTTTTTTTPPPDPDLAIFCSGYVPAVQAATYYAKWSAQNPGELARWTAFRDGVCASSNPVVPAMLTKFGLGLVEAGRMAL